MDSGLAALLGALIGGLLSAIAAWLLERRRESAQLRAELRAVRREVELEALDAVYQAVNGMQRFLASSHDRKSKKADREQAAQFAEWTQQFDYVQLLAVRVEVLASIQLGHQLRNFRKISLDFIDVTADQKGVKAWQANLTMEVLHGIIDDMQEIARRDLATSNIDKDLNKDVPPRTPELPLMELDLSIGGPNDPDTLATATTR